MGRPADGRADVINDTAGFLDRYDWLVDAFADRRRGTASSDTVATANVTLTADRALDLTLLLGTRRPLTAGRRTIRADAVNRALQPLGVTLDDLIEHRHGPIVPRPDVRAAITADRTAIITAFHDTVPAHLTAARTWITSHGQEALGRAVGATDTDAQRRLAQQAARVLQVLPDRPTPLSVLADTAGLATHALDRDTILSRLLTRILAAQAGQQPSASALAWRRLWARFDVIGDGLHTHAAVWHLPVTSTPGPVAAVAAAATAHGQPALIPYRALVADQHPWAAAPTATRWVFVVENTALVELAARDRVVAPVLRAQPDSADLMVLDALVGAGWQLAVSADFEPGGLAGARILLDRYPGHAIPWRLGVDDYTAAPDREEEPLPPDGIPDTPWDPSLAEAMRRTTRRVTEEARHRLLLTDMHDGVPSPTTPRG